MHDRLFGIAARLTDHELLGRVRLLATREREATVELVAHLAEFDTRKLHLAEGYGSLFAYCTEVLRLAEHAAYNRIEAARASRRFPAILDRLAVGTLNLSTLRLLAPHLTPENHEGLLDEAARKSKREVEALVARLAPRPDVPASVRKLPNPTRQLQAHAASAFGTAVRDAVGPIDTGTTDAATTVPAAYATAPPSTPPPATRSRPLVMPLSPERYRVQFTVGRATHENLRRAQNLLRREIPDGDPGLIFERALKLLLEDIARRKFAATTKPRPERPTAERSRHIPAHVKRAIWLRDGGQCAFVARSGRRCRERSFLEFHHVEPYAIGGETTSANLSLRCRAHNVHEAELMFGPCAPGVARASGEQSPLTAGQLAPGRVEHRGKPRAPAWAGLRALCTPRSQRVAIRRIQGPWTISV